MSGSPPGCRALAGSDPGGGAFVYLAGLRLDHCRPIVASTATTQTNGTLVDVTSAAIADYAASVCADEVTRPISLGIVREAGPVDDGETPQQLTAPAVAGILGMHRSRVLEIPRDELPYTTSAGGPSRSGRRYYQPEDVEMYRMRRAGAGPSVPQLARALAEQDRRISELERRVERLEQERPPAG